jgi:hypothetical protein
MEESMTRLASGMGWSAPNQGDLMLNAASESHPMLDEETQRLILQYNALDIDLYQRSAA